MIVLASTTLADSLLSATAMGLACSVLSVFVVLRRWAFIGEGIAHAGFGGAGTAWLLALLFPSVVFFSSPAGVYLIAVAFSLLVAFGIAMLTRRDEVRADTAIGIFLVGSLAWGLLAGQIYSNARNANVPGFSEMLMGDASMATGHFTLIAIALAAGVLLTVFALFKEILAYAFDPHLAEVSGVRTRLLHYLLILLVALTIVLGMRMMGSVLVVALLILPGATALLVSRNLKTVLFTSIVVGLIASFAGPLVTQHYRFLPTGPAIVLTLILQFLLLYTFKRLTRREA